MAPLQAGIYARISSDTEGTALGVARQVEDCQARASRLDWPVADTYTDNDISASHAKARPEYDRLLADLEAGRIDAVVVYDLDRLTRKPVELEGFIDLSERLGVALANVSGDVDLTTSAGRLTARVKGAVARQEAERVGERVKRQKQQRLAAGKPPGSRWRTFGYTRDWAVIPEEAAIVREVFGRIAAGESINSVTRDLRDRDVKRVSGAAWAYQATVRMVASPIYAGYLTYRGERVGEADVEPLVSEDLYEAATARRERRPGRVNVRAHLLSGIAVCGRCLTGMTVTGRREGSSAAYICNKQAGGCGRTTISRERLDELIENAIRTGLFVHGAEGSESAPEPEADRVEEQIAAIDDRIEATQAALTGGALSYDDGLPMLADLRKKRQGLEAARRREAETSARFLPALEDYENADLGRKVAEVRRSISAIIVGPVQKRGRNSFDPSRVEVVLASGERVGGDVLAERSFSFEALPDPAAGPPRCRNGHPKTEENTYAHPKTGKRHCRECRRAHH